MPYLFSSSPSVSNYHVPVLNAIHARHDSLFRSSIFPLSPSLSLRALSLRLHSEGITVIHGIHHTVQAMNYGPIHTYPTVMYSVVLPWPATAESNFTFVARRPVRTRLE